MTLRPVARLLGDVRRSAGPAPAGNASTGTDKWSAPPSGLVASFPNICIHFVSWVHISCVPGFMIPRPAARSEEIRRHMNAGFDDNRVSTESVPATGDDVIRLPPAPRFRPPGTAAGDIALVI